MSNNTMSDEFKPFLKEVANGSLLTRVQSQNAFDLIMQGEVASECVAAFLSALHVRIESVDEITGAAESLRNCMKHAHVPQNAIDIVGTGGDGINSWNISTASALVAAGAGVKVAKHGNRAVSSKSGSSDVLSALGINLNASDTQVSCSIHEAGFGFLMAPKYHPSMRHVGPIRAALGFRTIFNILGPMCNPGGVKRQLLGVYSSELCRPIAETMQLLGSEYVWVIHGAGGLDELSTVGDNHVLCLKNDQITEFCVEPKKFGLKQVNVTDLKGGNADENAQAITQLLDGCRDGPIGLFRDITLLNSGAAILVAGLTDELGEAIDLAKNSIDSGAALRALKKATAISQEDQ